jgi:hypothetical protein
MLDSLGHAASVSHNTRAREEIVGLALVPLYALSRSPARVVEKQKGKGKT